MCYHVHPKYEFVYRPAGVRARRFVGQRPGIAQALPALLDVQDGFFRIAYLLKLSYAGNHCRKFILKLTVSLKELLGFQVDLTSEFNAPAPGEQVL